MKKEFNSTQNEVKRKSYMPSIYRVKIKLLTKKVQEQTKGGHQWSLSVLDKTPIAR